MCLERWKEKRMTHFKILPVCLRNMLSSRLSLGHVTNSENAASVHCILHSFQMNM